MTRHEEIVEALERIYGREAVSDIAEVCLDDYDGMDADAAAEAIVDAADEARRGKAVILSIYHAYSEVRTRAWRDGLAGADEVLRGCTARADLPPVQECAPDRDLAAKVVDRILADAGVDLDSDDLRVDWLDNARCEVAALVTVYVHTYQTACHAQAVAYFEDREAEEAAAATA